MSNNLNFRLLRADEIDCRISTCNQYGVGLLLYKDARCDQNILDEIVGPMNWQRHHSRDNANCTVSIWDDEKKQWIAKEDTGTESYTEKEKGLASDSFKRACVNWGIGRELYTAPNMYVAHKDLKNHEKDSNGKWTCKDSFKVQTIDYVDDKIVYVKIINLKNNKEIEFGTPGQIQKEINEVEKSVIDEVKARSLETRCKNENMDIKKITEHFKVTSLKELTEKQLSILNQYWENFKEV